VVCTGREVALTIVDSHAFVHYGCIYTFHEINY